MANAAWARWTPVNLVGITAHLVGGIGILYANRERVAAQQGVGTSTIAKAALTGGALAVTGYSRVLGKMLEKADGEPVEGGTDPRRRPRRTWRRRSGGSRCASGSSPV